MEKNRDKNNFNTSHGTVSGWINQFLDISLFLQKKTINFIEHNFVPTKTAPVNNSFSQLRVANHKHSNHHYISELKPQTWT